jgi:beta-fructofuranosidase
MVNSGDTITAELPFELKGDTEEEFSVVLEGILKLEYSGGEAKLSFISDDAGCGRDARYAQFESCRDIRLIADTSSAEVYLNGGEIVFSTRMYPEDTWVRLTVNGISGTVYELGGIGVTDDE